MKDWKITPPENLTDRIRSGNLRPDELGTSQEKEIDKEWTILQADVDRLANFIMAECKGWPRGGGAIDTAIDIIKERAADRAALIRAVEGMKTGHGRLHGTIDCEPCAFDMVLALLHSPEKK